MSRKPTWSGRIAGGLHPDAEAFLNLAWDEQLIEEEDILASIAHVSALQDAGILSAAEAKRMTKALRALVAPFDPDVDEDVHSAVERALGDLGAKLHTGRSRNDLVATDLRLATRRVLIDLTGVVLDLVDALVARADEHAASLAPGYTHMQRGQPVTVGHWLLAHAFALERDVVRLFNAYATADVSPLGAGAIAGNTLGIMPSTRLGFSRTFDNSVDAVSARDFLLDAAYAYASASTHVSRLCEEIVVWSSAEFGFVRLPDGFSSGSSMMPQKRNPDVAELGRAEAGAAVGALVDLFVTTKGLALAYDRDLQASRRALGALDRASIAFAAVAGLVRELEFRTDRLAAATSDDALLATDLAEALVKLGVPFRRAHEMVAAVALAAERAVTPLREAITDDALAPMTRDEAVALLDPGASVERRNTPGGPSRASVRKQIGTLRRTVARRRSHLAVLAAAFPRR